MNYVIIIVVFVLIVFIALKRASNQIRKAEANIIGIIQTGSISILIKKYKEKYDSDFANSLAIAIIYKLYGLEPGFTSVQFASNNSEVFQKELSAIASDELAKYVAIVAKINQWIVKEDSTSADLESYLHTLHSTGIIGVHNDPKIPVSQGDYFKLGREFDVFMQRRV